MAPTLDGKSESPNTIVLDRFSGWLGLYGRGDVVAMRTPDSHDAFVVKRIIGFAGDTVVTRSGQSVVVPESHLWVGASPRNASLLSSRGKH
jgi:signal peptidase I